MICSSSPPPFTGQLLVRRILNSPALTPGIVGCAIILQSSRDLSQADALASFLPHGECSTTKTYPNKRGSRVFQLGIERLGAISASRSESLLATLRAAARAHRQHRAMGFERWLLVQLLCRRRSRAPGARARLLSDL